MKLSLRMWMLLTVVMLLSAAPLVAQEAAKPKLAATYSGFANKAGLNDEQRAKIAEVLATRKASLDAVAAAKKEINAERTSARAAGDEKKVNELKARYATEVTEREAQAQAQYNAVLRQVLTPEQLLEWEKARLTTSFRLTFNKYELTSEQSDKMDTVVANTAEAIVKLDPADSKGAAALVKKAKDDFMQEVLTAEQRQKFAKAKPGEEESEESSD